MRGLRLLHVGMAFALVALLLLARLAQLQLFQHDEWLLAARRSRTLERTLPFHRGRFLDARGEVLAQDMRSYDLMFQYRQFRRGHLAGQLLESFVLAGRNPGGLGAVMDQAESCSAALFGLSPGELQVLTRRKRDDLLFYLRGLGGLRGSAAKAAVERWAEEGAAPFGEAFPSVAAYFADAASRTRADLQRLESALGLPPGGFLEQLEEKRQELELRLRQRALWQAAGRAFGLTANQVRMRLTGAEPVGEVPWELSRLDLLEALAARWSLRTEEAALERLAEILVGGTGRDAAERLTELTVVLQAVERNQPDDQRGLRRALEQELHSDRVFRLAAGLDYEVVDILAQEPDRWPGLHTIENPTRVYPGSVAPHVIGLVRLADRQDLIDYQDLEDEYAGLARLLYRTPAEDQRHRELRQYLWRQAVRPGETRGRFGLEWVLEDRLRGERGYVEVLAAFEAGLRSEELDFAPPRNGEDVQLTIDSRLMRAAEAAIQAAYLRARTDPLLREKAAAVHRLEQPRAGFVLLDLEDGGVPVLATAPSYAVEDYRRRYGDLLADRAGPLRNRALGGGYDGPQTPYPGSTFKLVVAAEALARTPAYWQRRYECLGSWAPAGVEPALHCEGVHGGIAMREAVARSCNVFFYKLGHELGFAAIHARAAGLGFGAPTGIELQWPNEQGGSNGENVLLEGAAQWLAEVEESRRSLAPLRFSIGQVYVHASPLQMARFYGWLATGRLWRPRLVESVGSEPLPPEFEVPLYPDALRDQMLLALRDVVEAPHGTVRILDPESPIRRFRVAGKTGTAQTTGRDDLGEAVVHAWFTGFFPHDAPRYAFAVFCENAGMHGGDLASLVLEEFLPALEEAGLEE